MVVASTTAVVVVVTVIVAVVAVVVVVFVAAVVTAAIAAAFLDVNVAVEKAMNSTGSLISSLAAATAVNAADVQYCFRLAAALCQIVTYKYNSNQKH